MILQIHDILTTEENSNEKSDSVKHRYSDLDFNGAEDGRKTLFLLKKTAVSIYSLVIRKVSTILKGNNECYSKSKMKLEGISRSVVNMNI